MCKYLYIVELESMWCDNLCVYIGVYVCMCIIYMYIHTYVCV